MTKEAKDRINRRKIAYVYLMHRMFEGNPSMMLRVMGFSGIAVADLQDWDSEWRDAVRKTIEEEDSKGVELRPEQDVPSIRSIKEKLLRRVDEIIKETTDPARLASTYKVLSEFEVQDDRKEKSVLDAINESIRPLTPKKGTVTMLERMKRENSKKASDPEPEPEEEEENE